MVLWAVLTLYSLSKQSSICQRTVFLTLAVAMPKSFKRKLLGEALKKVSQKTIVFLLNIVYK